MPDFRFTKFEWDENKRQANRDKHGIDFAELMMPLQRSLMIGRAVRDGELRYLAVCKVGMRTVTVIFTETVTVIFTERDGA